MSNPTKAIGSGEKGPLKVAKTYEQIEEEEEEKQRNYNVPV